MESDIMNSDKYANNGKFKIYTGPVTENKLYEKALIVWGAHKQIRKFIQECNEACAAISQYYEDGKYSLDDVASELADVEIMLAQMKNIVNSEAKANLVENYKQMKLLRLENMLKEVTE